MIVYPINYNAAFPVKNKVILSKSARLITVYGVSFTKAGRKPRKSTKGPSAAIDFFAQSTIPVYLIKAYIILVEKFNLH